MIAVGWFNVSAVVRSPAVLDVASRLPLGA
jgi:hypothetical protein